jgi:hypothetical protein
MKVQFVSVGRDRREWLWKARGAGSNTITISGRFDSLVDAVRDAREQMDDRVTGAPEDPDPIAA